MKIKNNNKTDAQLTCLHMERREAKRRKGLLYGLRRPCLWNNTKTMHIRFSTSHSHTHSFCGWCWILFLYIYQISFVYLLRNRQLLYSSKQKKKRCNRALPLSWIPSEWVWDYKLSVFGIQYKISEKMESNVKVVNF